MQSSTVRSTLSALTLIISAIYLPCAPADLAPIHPSSLQHPTAAQSPTLNIPAAPANPNAPKPSDWINALYDTRTTQRKAKRQRDTTASTTHQTTNT